MANLTTPDYSIDYEDERLTNITDKQDAATLQTNQMYDGMIESTDKYYNDQINATKEWGDKQAEIQQANTDFIIEKQEQQKDQAHKDYIKEQSGAYVDWQKQSNQYGAEAEKMAANGLTGTGFSESSQVSMYNTYQNRVATARESYNRAVLEYDNAIKEAMLQNNAALAEIAYNTLQTTLSLSLEGFQYKNNLIIAKSDKLLQIDEIYNNQYMKMLDQINTEIALREDVRQFNENILFQEEENQKNRDWESAENQIQRDWQSAEAELDRKFEADQAAITRKFQAEQAELERKHDKAMLEAETKAEKEKIELQHKNDMAKLKKQQEYELAQLDKKLANDKALLKYESSLKASSSSGGSSEISGSSSGGSSEELTYAGISDEAKYPYAVNTAYYRGALNPDAKSYGTFSNGYQPKGISGHGKLSKTGDTVTFNTKTLSGQKQTVTQNVWKAADGTKWYWEGRQNKYIQVKK